MGADDDNGFGATGRPLRSHVSSVVHVVFTKARYHDQNALKIAVKRVV
jgi:hypothetical protein